MTGPSSAREFVTRKLLLATLLIGIALMASPDLIVTPRRGLAEPRSSDGPSAVRDETVRPDTSESPNEIAVDFDEPIHVRLVKLEVIDQAGVDHAIGAPIIRGDHRRISVRVGRMGPGIFTVNWGTVDAEGKRLEGTYTFSFEADRILGRLPTIRRLTS